MTPGRRRLEAALEGLYRVLLRAYSPGFRAALGEGMVEGFRDQLRRELDRGGPGALPGLLVRVVADVARNAPVERLEAVGLLRGPGPGGGGALGVRRRPGGGGAMGVLRDETWAATRRLRRAPVFTAVAVLSLGIGVGAFSSLFSVVRGVLLKPLPYEAPDRLVYVWRDYTWIGFYRGWLGGPDIAALRERAPQLQGVAALRTLTANLTGREQGEPEEVRVLYASADFFDLLGLAPRLGRGFLAGEDLPGAAPVVVLGHDLWVRRYGADPAVLGRDVYLDGEPARVVGVTAPGFRFVRHASLGGPQGADLYANFREDLAALDPGSGFLAGLARLRPGATRQALQADLDAVAAHLDREHHGGRGLRLQAVGAHEDLVKEVRPALLALLGGAGFLLLVLCANLATLLLGRQARRERELAVRAALGANGTALARGVLLEALLLAAAGAAAGFLLAHFGVRGLLALGPADLPRRGEVGLDAHVLAVAVGVALAAALVAALGPALRVFRGAPPEALREGTRTGEGRSRSRTRSALVVAQVALSLVLLSGAGLLLRSFSDLLAEKPGFRPDGVLTFRVPLSRTAYADPPSRAAFHSELHARVRALPGVSQAGAVSTLPLSAGADQTTARFPGAPGNSGDPREDGPLVDYLRATPGYAEAMGIGLLAGRWFDASDGADGPRVGVIDATLARRFFPAADAPGSALLLEGDTLTVVGVVEHARLYDVRADDRGQVYVPFAQKPYRGAYHVLRVERGDPRALAGAAREAARALDPEQPVVEVRTMREIVDASLGESRLSLVLLGGFGLGALLLAALGLYGVVANGVTRRTREMGVRMALGADRRTVRALVLRHALGLTLVGLALGLPAAAAATRLMESLLFGVRPGDPATLVSVAGGLAAVALLAAWLPARRATRIDPVEALRAE